MRFCAICDNMLYVDVRDNNDVSWTCMRCGNREVADSGQESFAVSTVDYRNEMAKYQHLMTPYIHDDPTIPHVSNIPCPNAACTRPEKEQPDVMYVKYDARNLRFLYSCAHCRFFWVLRAESQEPILHAPPVPVD